MSFEISSVGDFESFDYLCRGYFKEFLLPPMHPVPGSESALGDSRVNFIFVSNVTKVGTSRTYVKQKYLPYPHSVKSYKLRSAAY